VDRDLAGRVVGDDAGDRGRLAGGVSRRADDVAVKKLSPPQVSLIERSIE